MRLSLTMTGGAAGDLAETSKTWVDCGGTIGRADDCDWVLPDPGREISRCHARIRFMNGGFYMEDASANGVFLNDRDNRLNPGELHRLQDGERVFISDYQIVVQVDEDSLPAAPDIAPPRDVSTPQDSGYDSAQSYAGSSGDYAQWDPLASLGGKVEPAPTPVEPPTGGESPRQSYLEEHFAPPPVRPEPSSAPPSPPGGDAGGAPAIPSNWWQRSGSERDGPARDTPPEPPQSAPVDPPAGGDDPQQPDHRERTAPDSLQSEPASSPSTAEGASGADVSPMRADQWQQPATGQDAVTREAPPEAPPRPSAPPADDAGPPPSDRPAPHPAPEQRRQTPERPAAQGGANSEYRDALAVLLEGAGVNADDLTADTAEELGRILRVVVLGVMDLLRARSELKNEFRMPATLIQARENNPLKFSTNAEDALHNLLVKQNPDYLGPVAAFEASFDDLRAHQIAILAGMREAFMEMLDRFDPETLERQFEEKGRQGLVMGRMGRRRNWDMFKELFDGIRQDMDTNFHRLFGESFIRAYEAQMVRLQQSPGDKRD